MFHACQSLFAFFSVESVLKSFDKRDHSVWMFKELQGTHKTLRGFGFQFIFIWSIQWYNSVFQTKMWKISISPWLNRGCNWHYRDLLTVGFGSFPLLYPPMQQQIIQPTLLLTFCFASVFLDQFDVNGLNLYRALMVPKALYNVALQGAYLPIRSN